MTQQNTFVRLPSKKIWIRDITEAEYDPEEKIFYSIIGKFKRVLFYATIVEKREIVNRKEGEVSYDTRLEFEFDDGTDVIRGILWQVEIEDYRAFQTGDIVKVIGIARMWKDFISITPEIIKKVENPNLVLLWNLEIVKKYKDKNIKVKSEKKNKKSFKENEEIESFNGLLFDVNNIKEKIFSKIVELGGDLKGIPYEEIKENINISGVDLKRYLTDLEIDTRIYQSKTDHYQLV